MRKSRKIAMGTTAGLFLGVGGTLLVEHNSHSGPERGATPAASRTVDDETQRAQLAAYAHDGVMSLYNSASARRGNGGAAESYDSATRTATLIVPSKSVGNITLKIIGAELTNTGELAPGLYTEVKTEEKATPAGDLATDIKFHAGSWAVQATNNGEPQNVGNPAFTTLVAAYDVKDALGDASDALGLSSSGVLPSSTLPASA